VHTGFESDQKDSSLKTDAGGRLRYRESNVVNHAIGYAMHRSRPHDAVIRGYDDAGNMIETHEHAGDFKEW